MKKLVLPFCLSAAALNVAGCRNGKAPGATVRDYSGTWSNVFDGFLGPLDHFNFVLNLTGNGSGTLTATYKATQQAYPQTTVKWEKMEGDSVKIRFAFAAWPAASWELHGLANYESDRFDADYYFVPANDPANKQRYGTLTFTRK